MNNIKVRLLETNANVSNMPLFLAKLTQRGHKIGSILDIEELYDECRDKPVSEYFMTTPHTTLRRMTYFTVAVEGLSTKCVSQLRTHAKRLTFMSTSTQYSLYDDASTRSGVVPLKDLSDEIKSRFDTCYKVIFEMYDYLCQFVSKDEAAYILPQGLRKALIISGNLDDWQYVIRTRLCHRNSEETQQVMKLIYNEIKNHCGEEVVRGMLPECCKEGKFSCGRPFDKNELEVKNVS